MNTTTDGDFQTFKANDGKYVRDNFFGRDPRTAKMVADWSDDEIWALRRGGHDYRKVYAAYKSATTFTGAPTVILAHTIKGYFLGQPLRGTQRDPPDEEVRPNPVHAGAPQGARRLRAEAHRAVQAAAGAPP
jgi:pyruvate dehydrogenase complex dehydrogenase (E1) component